MSDWPFGDLPRGVDGQTILAIAPSKNGFRRILVRCVCGFEREVDATKFVQFPRICKDCTRRAQTGPLAGNWQGGRNTPLTTYNKFKRSAARRSIEWCLTIEDLDDLYDRQRGLCAMSEQEISWDHGKNGKRGNASLDRIDSARGYTTDNVQLITKSLNIAKQSFKYEDFVGMCIAVTNAHLC